MPNVLLKSFILICLFFCLLQKANAEIEQNKSHIILKTASFSVPEGLSQSTVTSIVEDQDGYIWIGTLNGLNRFDGKEFKHYYANGEVTNLPSSFIRSLLITQNNTLLVGTDKGLAIFNKKNETFSTIQDEKSLRRDEIWSLDNKSASEVIIGTNNDILILDLDKKSTSSLLSKKANSEIKKVISIGSTVYFKTYDGVTYKINDKDVITIMNDTLDIERYNDDIYIAASDGVYSIINNKTKKISSYKYDFLSSSINELYGINQNYIYKLLPDGKRVSIGEIADEFGKDKKTYFTATGKTILLGLNNLGFRLIRDSFNLVKTLNIAKEENVWHISKTHKNEILVSTDNSKIKFYSNELKLLHSFDTEITGYKNAIFNGNGIYVGHENGLRVFNRNSEYKDIISNETITTLNINANSNLIAGTTNGKIFFIKGDNISQTVMIKSTPPVFDLLYLSDSNIYIATQDGTYHYLNGILRKISQKLTYSLSSHKEFIVLGTSSSIDIYDPKKLKTEEYVTHTNGIYSIKSIDDYIFASSLGNVIITNKKNTYILSTENGSQFEYNTPSGLLLDDDHVLFGGIDGISYLSKSDILSFLRNIPLPNTELSELRVFNKPKLGDGEYFTGSLNLSDSITLKYSDYPFTISFNSPNSSASRINFQYKLEGLSNEWIASNQVDSATYTNLSAGSYIFKVYAVDLLSEQNGPIKEIRVIITPPWWLSIEAKLVYFLVLLMITFFIIKSILRKRAIQKKIALSEERLKLSLWGSGDEMWDWDIETGNIFRSNIWGSLEFPKDGHRSGKEDEESNIHPMDQKRVKDALNKHFSGESDHFEAAYRVKGKDEHWIWILDRAKIVERDDKDNPLRMTGTIKNISQFKQKEEQLRLFEKAIENISEGMFILDDEYKFVEVNQACCSISQRVRNEFIGNLLKFDLYPDNFSTQIRTMLKQQGYWSGEVEASRGDNNHFHMELTIDAIYDDLGELSHYVGVFSDISRRKQQEEELRKLTNNDLLTGLPNRSNLQVTLGNLVNKEIAHALMVVDLDNFKRINDSLGHQLGDKLLQMVAERIKKSLPKNTSVYRLGGDEFAIVLDKNTDINASAAISNKIIEAFKGSFEIDQEILVLGLSIGIVIYPDDEQSEQGLLRKADIAMYHAKSAGGNCYQFYSEALNLNAIRLLSIENLIREGLKDDLFEVYYQPKIDIKRSKIAGMEALVRLNHPIHGIIPPNDFIPLAEENGLIIEIGDIVLRKACFAAQKWREQGLFNGRVAVNLSSRQFALPDLQQRIASILTLTKLPAAHLELEITEGTVIKQPEAAILVMQQLSKMGVSLALDDFGTGYSSLSYLKRFPINTLKIDKAFVDDIDKSDRDLKMVDSIITIAHNMGLSVVGEGVEQTAQLNILKALNCEEIQGYIFSKAVKESEFTLLLQADSYESSQINHR